MSNPTAPSQDGLRERLKSLPLFYRTMTVIFGPALLVFGPGWFLKNFPRPGRCLNLGAGVRRLGPGVENIDIAPAPMVDIVADIAHLPIADASVARFVCDNVLEHVPDVEAAVREMHRILEPGGIGYVSTPFLYPVHASPSDFHRWTAPGLLMLFKDFELVKIGTRSGPFSTLNVWLCYTFATIFCLGSDKLFWLLVNASLFLFFPVKLLDLPLLLLPQSLHSASVFYLVVRKHG